MLKATIANKSFLIKLNETLNFGYLIVRGIFSVGNNLREKKDEEIMSAVLGGDKEAYGILVDRYTEMLFGYAFNLCGDYDSAADLAQETFITAYNCLDRLKNPSSFSSWIAGIMKNKYRNLGRERTIPTIPLEYLKDKGFEPPDSDTKPQYSNEDLNKIMKNLYSLPEKYREVLILRYMKDFSYKEIAAFLHLSVSTVTMRLIYARRLLIKKAKEDGLL